MILSGDDMTAVCDADIALEFTKNFIEEFENETDKKKPAIEQKLTMCAGITYCNEKFPFHYAVSLAEELCSAAKKHSKNKYVENQEKDIAPSCLMFHNVQSSNFRAQKRRRRIRRQKNARDQMRFWTLLFGRYDQVKK